MLENVKDLHGDTPVSELTREQLIERLEGAAMVTQNLQRQLESAAIVHSAVAEESSRRAEKLQRYAERMVDLASDLARAGSYDHKGKNEAILSVIAVLLSYSVGMKFTSAARDMDDIPF